MAAKGISAAGCPAIGEGRLGTEGEAPKVPAARRGDIARAGVLFLLCVLVYEFSSGAHAYSVDEITNYASARALVESGTPDLRFEHPFPPEQLLTVRHPESGRLTGRYGLLSWLPMVPLYALASATGPGAEPPGPVFPQPSQVLPLVVLLYNPIVAALLVAITFLLGRELGLRPGYAVAAALILAIGSPLWVYAKTLANMPAATTFAVAAILAAARARDGGRAWPAMSGVLAALAGLVRPEFVVLAVVAAPLALTSTDSCVRTRAGRLLTWTLAWAIVAVPGIGLWNLYRTGSFFDTGYGATTILWQTERAYIGVLGILGSPSFGLFVLVPVTALGVWGLLTARRYRSLWITMAGLVALAIVGYGSFRDWFGGVSWGSRYLLSVMPLLALGAAAILQDRRVGRLARLGALTLTLWGVGISVLGVLFDYQSGWRNLWDEGAKPEQILWDPHFSLIGAHLRLARQWADGLIGPDLYLPHKLGVWTIPALTIGLLAVAAMALIVEIRGIVRARLRGAEKPEA